MSSDNNMFEVGKCAGEHSIKSDHIECCSETGRVAAVFYDDDINKIEQLEAENKRLRDELELYRDLSESLKVNDTCKTGGV